MKLKSATIFTAIYLIHYDIVHLASARHRVSLSIHKPISERVSRLPDFRELNQRVQRF